MKTFRHRVAACTPEQGFTLLEAFVVLAIIAVLGIISVPAIMNTLTYQKLASATNSFVNQVEFARVQAASRNRAYRLRVELSDGTNSGAIYLDEGIGSACTLANFAVDGAGDEPIIAIRTVNFEEEWEEIQITGAEPAGLISGGEVHLCVKPDGRVLAENGSTIPAPPGYAAGEALFRLRLFGGKNGENWAETDQTREIVVPYNGIPKVRNSTE
jgi:Tfp pilus assembly protein FimT